MPYGIARNDQGEWMAFNREYLPIGFNDVTLKGMPGHDYMEYSIYAKYKKISDAVLTKLTSLSEGCSIQKNELNEIVRIYFYNDNTNPTNNSTNSANCWEMYFSIIRAIS